MSGDIMDAPWISPPAPHTRNGVWRRFGPLAVRANPQFGRAALFRNRLVGRTAMLILTLYPNQIG
jgi:hypothetical protein